MTQIEYAEKGIITPEIRHVAETEQRSPEFIAERVAAGTIVIPANINHKNLVPCGIGRELKTKINANLGNSSLSSCPGAEKSKLAIALHYGADTVMDLSTGGEITSIRQSMLEQSTAPLGTVPIYEIVARYGSSDFAKEKILSVILVSESVRYCDDRQQNQSTQKTPGSLKSKGTDVVHADTLCHKGGTPYNGCNQNGNVAFQF